MKIRVQDPSDLSSLIVFLRRQDYVAEQVAPNTIEVSRLSSVRHGRVRMELDLFLKDLAGGEPRVERRVRRLAPARGDAECAWRDSNPRPAA